MIFKKLIKILVVFLLVLIGLEANAQVTTTTDRLFVRQNLSLRGLRIDSLSLDPNFAAGSNNVIASQLAVKLYIANVLSLKANLLSPHLTGTPTVPDLATSDSSGTIINSKFVKQLVAAAVGVTNLSLGTVTATTAAIANTAGTGLTLPASTSSLAGLMSALQNRQLDSLYTRKLNDTLLVGGLIQHTVSVGGKDSIYVRTTIITDTIKLHTPLHYNIIDSSLYSDTVTASVDGILLHTDWAIFNAKAPTANPSFTGVILMNGGTDSASTKAYARSVGGGSGGVWGSITGTLTAQSDLNTALGAKAPLASPSFTGAPNLPTGTIVVTQSAGDNSTKVASTAYTDNASSDQMVSFLQLLGSSIKAQTLGLQLAAATNTNALGASATYFIPVHLLTAQTLTGVKFYQKVQGSYTASAGNQVALFSLSGSTYTLVASSTDDGTLFQAAANTTVTKAFSSTYAAAVGYYAIGLLYNESAQTTAPSLQSGLLPSAAFDGIKIVGYSSGGTLPATKAVSALTYTNNVILAAVY